MTYKITDHLTGLTHTAESVYDVIDLNALANPYERELVAELIELEAWDALDLTVEAL